MSRPLDRVARAVAIVAGATALTCAAPLAAGAASSTTAKAQAQATPKSDALRAFRSCEQIVTFGRRAAGLEPIPSHTYTPGFGSPISPRAPLKRRPRYISGPETQDAVAAAGGPEAPKGYSETNVQEAGIDEPDVVKTDGRRLFVAAGDVVRAYDLTDAVPKLKGVLNLGAAGGQLLLSGDRLLVLSTAGENYNQTRLAEVDVSNPEAMRTLRTVVVPGLGVTARLTGTTVRVVLNTPEHLPSQLYNGRRTAAGRKLRRTLRLRSFVPSLRLADHTTGTRSTRPVASCTQVSRPAAYSGLDLVTVLTFDLDRGLGVIDSDAILASAETIYASTTGLYVASTAYGDIDESDEASDRARTQLHKFDVSQPGGTSYAASGSVPGYVLNTYSISESRGDLRIATTESPLWVEDAQVADSSSRVSVLRQSGAQLVEVGRVDGLGRGERIHSARFIGDMGYLVTFRETDPLYTLDLRDPAAPKVAGELKITGFSSYLHPIGDGLLLGVGQEADAKGQTLGTQASIFDVSNPAAPTRLAQIRLGNGSSPVEYDPYAFLWWGPERLAIFPVTTYSEDPKIWEVGQAAVVLRAGRAEGLAKVGQITHGPAWDQGVVHRSVVVGDRLLTISDFGIGTSRLADLGLIAYDVFPAPISDAGANRMSGRSAPGSSSFKPQG